MDREIRLSASEADELLDILDDVVVSLDRIGSRGASGEDRGRQWFYEYFTTGGATQRLAQARFILSTAFDRVYSEDELEAKWSERSSGAWTKPPADSNDSG